MFPQCSMPEIKRPYLRLFVGFSCFCLMGHVFFVIFLDLDCEYNKEGIVEQKIKRKKETELCVTDKL